MKTMKNNFLKIIKEMKAMADILVEYSFPKVSKESEAEINILKIRNICIDGYDLILHFNKADYEKCFINSLQIFSKFSTFLPFNVVFKIARKFLGNDNLFLYEEFATDKKVYCWCLNLDKENNPVKVSLFGNEVNLEECEFDGFLYYRIL
jgi:hypothetical protein